MKTKYRFWSNDLQDFIDPIDVVIWNGRVHKIIYNILDNDVMIGEEMDVYAQQSSGITDDSGIEIYEGDIIMEYRDLDKDCIEGDVTTYQHYSEVTLENGYFTHDKNHDYDPFFLITNSFRNQNMHVRIVGNIFQTPLLIKN